MAQAIKWEQTAGGSSVVCTLTNWPNIANQAFSLSSGDTITADLESDNFRMMAKGAPDGVLVFPKSVINKSGSSPALTSTATGDLQLEIVDNFFPKASGGGGNLNFTALANTIWDGNKRKTLGSAFYAGITGTGSSRGMLRVVNQASWPFYVNGVSIPVNDSGTNGGITWLSYILYDTGKIDVFDKDGVRISADVDTVAPTLTSAATIDAHTINATMSEPVFGTIAGWSAKQNGTVITPDSVTGASVLAFVFSETFLGTDTFLLSYDATIGDTLDSSGNPLASFTDHAVTNSINSLPTAIAAYNMNASPGVTADAVGSHTLTNSGSVTTTTGKINQAASLTTGKALYNTTLAPNSAGLTQPWSINMWIKPTSLPGAAAHLFGRNNVAEEFLCYLLSNGELHLSINNDASGSNLYDRAFSSLLSAGTWYMITAVFTGSALNLYVNAALANGSVVGSGAANAVYYSASNRFNIGDDGSGYIFDGLVDAVSVHTIALTGTEITALYNGGAGAEY